MNGMSLQPGVLVAFEGIDGAGKTTQASLLAGFLKSKGFNVVSTKEPTGSPQGQRIRESAQSGRLPPEVELALFLEDRAAHVRDLIAPKLEQGAVVIVDRYYFSTVAYQGARGMDPQQLLQKNEAFAPVPDVLVLLDVDPELGLARVAKRGDRADLFEEKAALAVSRQIFASIDKDCAMKIDGTKSIDEISFEIRERLLYGPLLRRLCRDVRDHHASTCGHVDALLCDWLALGPGWSRPIPDASQAVGSAIAGGGTPEEQVAAVRDAIYRHAASAG
jgi:dTMP kinase